MQFKDNLQTITLLILMIYLEIFQDVNLVQNITNLFNSNLTIQNRIRQIKIGITKGQNNMKIYKVRANLNHNLV